MRIILLFASALLLANCATPNGNANGSQQQAADVRADEPDVPLIFRKPPPQFNKWGGYGYGGRY